MVGTRNPRVKHIPGWEKGFLMAIRNGYNEKTAANTAGVGTGDVQLRLKQSPEFKKRYEEATANRKPRPTGGIF